MTEKSKRYEWICDLCPHLKSLHGDGETIEGCVRGCNCTRLYP